MDEAEDAASRHLVEEMRQKVGDFHELLGRLVPEFLEDHARGRVETREALEECKRLQQRLAVLEAQNQDLRRQQNELVETLNRFVNETGRLTNELIQKLRASPLVGR